MFDSLSSPGNDAAQGLPIAGHGTAPASRRNRISLNDCAWSVVEGCPAANSSRHCPSESFHELALARKLPMPRSAARAVPRRCVGCSRSFKIAAVRSAAEKAHARCDRIATCLLSGRPGTTPGTAAIWQRTDHEHCGGKARIPRQHARECRPDALCLQRKDRETGFQLRLMPRGFGFASSQHGLRAATTMAERQMFGASQQVPRAGGSYKEAETAELEQFGRGPSQSTARPVTGSALPSSQPVVEQKPRRKCGNDAARGRLKGTGEVKSCRAAKKRRRDDKEVEVPARSDQSEAPRSRRSGGKRNVTTRDCSGSRHQRGDLPSLAKIGRSDCWRNSSGLTARK